MSILTIKDIVVDKSWTLFLDRDGVINKRLVDDYVKSWSEFEFLDAVPESIAKFSEIFGIIVVVTNQQGIGKKLMSEGDLKNIHDNMGETVKNNGGRIDKFYHCPLLKSEEPNCRKPLPVMGLKAKKDFPEIDFKKSIMVGDSISDMEFGRALGMFNVFITPNPTKPDGNLTHYQTTNLKDFTSILQYK